MKKLSLCFVLSISACGGSGSVAINTWGEEYIEQEIPAAPSAEEAGFVDGFTVKYTKFLVAISDIRIGDATGEIGASADEQRVWDLHLVGPHAVTTLADLEDKRWDAVEATVKPASGATRGNAADADVAMMNTSGYSIFVAGTIETSSTSKSFNWGFTTATRYFHCEEDDGSLGVVVPNGGTADIQFTNHGDHLFYDDLQADDTKLRATELVKADRGDDGEVTLEDLAGVDLTTVPDGQYGGGDGSVENMRQFVTALSRTIIHFNGEGECTIEAK